MNFPEFVNIYILSGNRDEKVRRSDKDYNFRALFSNSKNKNISDITYVYRISRIRYRISS